MADLGHSHMQPRRTIVSLRMHVQAAPSAERESLYEDFMKEKEKKEREAKKAERKRRMAAFRELLENTKSIKVSLIFPSQACTGSAQLIRSWHVSYSPPQAQ